MQLGQNWIKEQCMNQCSIVEHSQSCYAEIDGILGHHETSQVENIGEMVRRMV